MHLYGDNAEKPQSIEEYHRFAGSGDYNGDRFRYMVVNNVAPKSVQTISVSDVVASYGDTDISVSVTTDGDGSISYAVKEGSQDYININNKTGALTIKDVPLDGKAYVIVTAAETDTYVEATKEVTVSIIGSVAPQSEVSYIDENGIQKTHTYYTPLTQDYIKRTYK